MMKNLIWKYLDANYLVKPLAWFSIAVAIITWGMELTGMVSACPYCQTQRTMIGLSGIMMLLPWNNIVTRYFVLVFSFLGAQVAATQVFSNFMRYAFDEQWIYLASCALFIMMGQIIVTFTRTK